MDKAACASHSLTAVIPAADLVTCLRRVEADLAAGRLDSARSELGRIRESGDNADALHLLALVERNSGDAMAAEEAFSAAMKLAPENSRLLMNFGNFRQALGQLDQALDLYDRALALSRGALDTRFNRLLALTALGRIEEALPEADSLLGILPAEPRLHSTRGVILRAFGRLSEAAEAFDRALALDPRRTTALQGRAQIALDRDEDGASDRYRRALAIHPDDRVLVVGLAEALEGEGRSDQAVTVLEQAVRANPSWVEGQAALARMRWEANRDEGFVHDLQSALEADPANGALWSVLATSFAGADLSAAAAQAASDGVRATSGDIRLQLLEAFLVSEAGEIARADDLFAAIPSGVPGRAFSEARHALRAHRFDRASALLEEARSEAPWDIAVWAMTSLAWRLTHDRRADWLNAPEDLIRTIELDLNEAQSEEIAKQLRSLHRTRVRPLHQSLRGGTQSRGRLFERDDPAIQLFAAKIRDAVDGYWRHLPAADSAHPLLRHRDSKLIIEGSWSVRLTDGGFHIPHFHPEGILSSAAYVVVPEACTSGEGWLEIGAAPPDLELPLEPLKSVEPRPGRLSLFPSYLFHSTRPFSAGERLTAAFDVVTV